MVNLLRHNEEAYEKIKETIADGQKKIAVSHATGTGKSYLIAKLFEDYSNEKKLVLVPSAYISDQIQELFEKYSIQNADILLYQKLIKMSDADIAAMDYDVIALDEYHHDTSKVWGNKVRNLIDTHSESIIFGTSATPVRSDGVNTIDELFEGNCVSDLPLSESIAKKIVPLPKYVGALYELDDELEKLRQKVENATNTNEEKQEFYKKINTMRSQIEKSYGMPIILNKHIKNKEGKYIIFCKKKKHLREIKDTVIGWFKTAGFKNINAYEVYSDYENKDVEYKAFCNDTSHNLKLLFCVNMLNEGLHLENISGVLLLRLTRSSIVWHQQIGRAIEANNTNTPVIIDAVNNFSAVGQGMELLREIKDAIAKEKESDPDFDDSGFEEIDTFFVLEQIVEIQEMFREIEERLEGSWENGLKHFDKYVREHNGDVLVPLRYTDEDGFLTGSWVSHRRRDYKNRRLFKKGINELEERGFVWDTLQYNFETNFEALKQYKNREGNCLVPKNHIEVVNRKEINLGKWCTNLRMGKKGKQRCALTKERIEQLEKLGFIWDTRVLNDLEWEKNFKKLCEYKNKYGDFFQIKDKELSRWCTAQRMKMRKIKDENKYNYRIGMLEEWKVDKLNSIGFCWNSLDEAFLYQLEELKKYYETHNKFMQINRTENKKLSTWCAKIRDDMKNGKLEEWKIEKLKEIGFPFDPNKIYFEAGCRYYVDFKKKNGDVTVPKGYQTVDGFKLDSWISSQKNKYRKSELTDNERNRLNEIGFCFSINNDNFDKSFELLMEYMEVNHCDSDIPQTTIYKGEKLGIFVSSMRSSYKNKSISDYRKKRLQSIGFIWDVKEKQWTDNLEWFKKNKDNHGGEICISKSDVSVKSYYDWLVTQRMLYRKGKMREDRRKLFKQVIMS